MKDGRTLPELAAELERQAAVMRDYLLPAEDLRVHSNGTTALLLEEPFPLTEIAHSQLAQWLGVPKAFYDRLRGKAEELRIPIAFQDSPERPVPVETAGIPLFDATLNCLFGEKAGERRFIRTLDGHARAVLSDQFNPDLDNLSVFSVAARVLSEAGLRPEHVASCEVTERKLYLKVLSPRLEAEIRPEQLRDGHGFLKNPMPVQAGFLLSNSEVGLGALVVQQFVCVLVCRNGLIFEDCYRQRHLGRVLEADEAGGIYRSDTRQADVRTRLLKLRDHIEAALDETRFLDTVDKMQQAAGIPLSGSLDRTVESVAKQFGLTQVEKDSVMRELITGADLSLWGLSNALTATAGRSTEYDRATELEALGGRLISLSPQGLRELVGPR